MTEALERRSTPAKVTYEVDTNHYKLDFEIINKETSVSIIIPSKDNVSSINKRITSEIYINKNFS